MGVGTVSSQARVNVQTVVVTRPEAFPLGTRYLTRSPGTKRRRSHQLAHEQREGRKQSARSFYQHQADTAGTINWSLQGLVLTPDTPN